MKIGRLVPPAAAPLGWSDLWHGIAALLAGEGALRRFEDEIRREFDVRHVFLVSSGTAALALTFDALASLSPRRKAAIPAFTCFSVPAAVLKAGLRPVPCDIDDTTFDYDRRRLAETIDEDTLCVVAHHLYGVPSAIDEVRAICEPRGIYVVEDAAQAMGGVLGGRRLGTIGDVGIFSLGRGKNITCGSGGIIVTNSDDIAAAIRARHRQLPAESIARAVRDLVQIAIMAFFIHPRLYWIPAALPFLKLGETIFPKTIEIRRLSAMKAGLLRNWRDRLAEANRVRAETATYYGRHLGLAFAAGASHPYLRLPIVAASPAVRERIRAAAERRGLGVSVGYPTPVDAIPEMRPLCGGARYPSARRVAETLVTLPTHHWLTDGDKRAIAELCREVIAA